MRIEKRFLAEMNRCYAAASIQVDGATRLLLATEGEGPCLAWTGPDYQDSHPVWDGPGGTMAMVPVPGTNGEFLAVQKFFRMFQWEEAKLVHVRPLAEGGYQVSDLLRLPYIHRFDLLPAGGRLHFLGCTLATSKQAKDDWTDPGRVWVGEYTGPGNLEVRELRAGFNQNHGYSRLDTPDGPVGLVTCQQGAFRVAPPARPGADWTVDQFMDWPISDIAAVDLDGDGELEYATIEPFHGSRFRVWKRYAGRFELVYEHPEVSEFYHVVVATRLAGTPGFLGGCRRGRQQLFFLRAAATSPLRLAPVLIDEGVGPSNVAVVHERGRDIIVAANREKAEAAIYLVAGDR
jgi:hypothetical protein